jgi:nitroreductase
MNPDDAIKHILTRRSIRKYTEDAVENEPITAMLKAAMAAPSAANRKPWHFVVVKKRETLDRMADALQYGKMLVDAPLAIAVCGNEEVSENYWVQDCSAATENILLAADSLGLGAVWLGVYPIQDRIAAISEILGLSPPILPLNVIAIGHPDEEKEARTQYDEGRVHYEHG